MTGIQEQPKDMLGNVGLIPSLIPEAHLFKDFSSCIEALEAGEVNPNPNEEKSIDWNLN
jgi:SulP family sulfate permease